MVLSASALAVVSMAPTIQTEPVGVQIEAESIDAMDFAGGSKLKDRMMVSVNSQEIKAVHVLIKA